MSSYCNQIQYLFFVLGLSCSTCMTSLYGGTNNLSRSFSDESNFLDKTKDKESTQIHHPEEDYSTAAFVSAVSLHSMNLPIAEMGNSQCSVFSATLPGPGDPGAPPLPPELQDQQEPCTSSSDNCFLPLRSRSVQPQWTPWLSSLHPNGTETLCEVSERLKHVFELLEKLEEIIYAISGLIL